MRCPIAAALFVVALPAAARANGRYPAATQIVADRDGGTRYAARTTFGLILSKDGGATWDWLCEDAMGITSTNADPTLGFALGGALVAADQSDGLAQSTDFGCGWNVSTVLDRDHGGFFDDLVVRPNAPHVVLALNSGHVTGTNDDLTQVYQSSDDGATWTAHGAPLDKDVLADTIEVSKSDPMRIYVSGVRGDGPSRAAALFVSKDDGATWEEHDVPFDPSVESGIFISAVDDANPDVVYVRTAWQGLVPQTPPVTKPARLLVTNDGGKTWNVAYRGQGPLFGFALANGKVYVGGPDDGLRVASASDLAFQKTSDVRVQGLMPQGSSLWAASAVVSGFILATTSDDGAHWEKKLAQLCDIRGPLACAPGAKAGVCPDEWPKIHDDLFLCDLVADAGADAGPPNDAPPAAPAHGGCGCNATQGAEGSAVAALLALLLTSRRRARANPSR